MALTSPEPPLTLFELKPERLHDLWPFIRHGLEDIVRKVKPDWIPEDVYAALRAGQATCVIGERSNRPLGFSVFYKQIKPFSAKPELFIWGAWDRPYPRRIKGELVSRYHRIEGDNIAEVADKVWRYQNNVAISNYGTDTISFGTSWERAKGFMRKYGWKPAYVTFHIKAEANG